MKADLPARITAVVSILAVVAIASMPWWAERATIFLAVEMLAMLALAQMWNLLAGYAGMVSVGQQAFFGLGGYLMLALGNLAGVNPFVAIPIAAAATALVAVPVSWVAFRLQGGYFAIGTWVIAEVFRLSFANWAAVGGGSGTSLVALRGIPRFTREATTYWMALAAVVLVLGMVPGRVFEYAVLAGKQLLP